ncbi:uncharacterized protein LOC142349074 [Convolutriloba macropyga]|uniref:uncharacterized protein LOC142349074 n=1 Tax=Convolutriloba macropyga TaxID=536237 RepID=UPI003F528586
MPIGGYHMTKEIDCAPVKVYIKPLQSDQQSFLLTHVIAVPNLNMSPVDTEKLNQLCASFEHLSHISFPEIAINSVSIIFGIDNLDLIHYKQIGTQECSLGSRDPARLDMCRKDRFGTRRNIHRQITPEDRKFLRFLWINDGSVDTYEYTSHIFGATDSHCIASYALRKSARDSCEQFPDVIKFIERNVYMDDLYVATDSVEKAQRILREMRATLSRGGFNLTKWNSNSSEFLETLEPGIRLDPSKVQPQSQKAAWNQGPKSDKPLLVQNFPDFVSLRDEIPNFKDLQIPRNYFLDKPIRSVQLHTFTDASEFALSAVCYIGVEYSDQSIAVRFVIGKTRVAPLKNMIILNLELQAAVYGAQLAQFVKEEQDIHFAESIFWSDSTTVLYWLPIPEMRHKIFIANRLAKILDVSSAFDWRYIPSAANPADDGTRGYSVYQMTSESRWISDWL